MTRNGAKVRKAVLATVLAAAASGCSAPPQQPPPPAFDLAQCLAGLDASKGDQARIPTGGCIRSPGKAYFMMAQPSGALEILPAATGPAGDPLWSAGVPGAPAAVVLQEDGNLVIYQAGTNAAVWASGAAGGSGPFHLSVDDQGGAQITELSTGKVVWSIAPKPAPFSVASCAKGLEAQRGKNASLRADGCVAAPNGSYALIMARAGALNIVPVTAEGVRGVPVWTSGSKASAVGAAFAQLQEDGNFVIYDPRGPIWNSETNGAVGAYRLGVTEQGEAVLQAADGRRLWSSKTGKAK